jgi:intracellular septation protein
MTEPQPKPSEIIGEANTELALKPGEPQQNWIKMGVDFGPLICFGLAFLIVPHLVKSADKETPLIWASGVLAVASVVALVVGLVAEKRIAWLALVTAVLGIPFAVLTVVFKNPVFIKIKMTLIDALIGGVLLGGLALKKQPLKALLADTLKLKDEAWPRLTLYYALFYLAMAAGNEIIWRTQTDGVWVTWKMVSMVGGPVLFSILMLPFMMKNMIVDEPASKPATVTDNQGEKSSGAK